MTYRDPAGHDPVDPLGFVWTAGRRRALWLVLWPLAGLGFWLATGLGWASWLSALRCAVGGAMFGCVMAALLRAVSDSWPWETTR